MGEHAVYVSQKAEMEDGLQGVKLALKILKEYYGSEADHEAATGAGEGIIGLIEVIESDMTKTLTEIEATEKASAAEYDRQTKENEIMAATWSQDVKYKTKEQTELEEQVSQAMSDRSSVQAELDAVLESLKLLEDRCIAKPMTYEERMRRREAEIAGLKEALEILNGEDVLAENERRSAGNTRGVDLEPPAEPPRRKGLIIVDDDLKPPRRKGLIIDDDLEPPRERGLIVPDDLEP